MTASSAPSKEPSVRRESPLPSRWRVLGTLLVTVGFLLFTFSDACGPPPKFEAMEMVGKQKPSYSPGDRVNYKCKQGWEHAYTFTTTTYCELNNSWLPITDWACEKLKCPKLPTIPHCREHLVNGTIAWGHQVHFVCDEGYYLVGRKFILCQLKGARTFWSHAVPRCEKILCSPPPKIKDGKYTFSDVDIFEYAESVTYSCDPSHGEDEFSLVGEKSLYCVANGVWSTSPPECRVVKCLYPELKNGRQITGFRKKYYYQATVMFECNLGYHVRGSDTVVCNSNGTWEPPIPTCVKGPRPTHPTKPPVYNYPGYPEPREIFNEDIDAWLIALIVVTAIAGIAVCCTCLYKSIHGRKKKGLLCRKREVTAGYTAFQHQFPRPAECTINGFHNPAYPLPADPVETFRSQTVSVFLRVHLLSHSADT